MCHVTQTQKFVPSLISIMPPKKNFKFGQKPARYGVMNTAGRFLSYAATNPWKVASTIATGSKAVREAANFARRFGSSRTKTVTKTKGKGKSVKVKPPSDGESKSLTVYKKKPSKRYKVAKNLTNSCTLEYTDSNVKNSGTAGVQGVNSLNGQVSATIATSTPTRRQGNGALVCGGSESDIANLMARAYQYYNRITSTSVTTAPFQNNFKETKFLLESATQETHIVNNCQMEFKMIIYDLIAKKTAVTLRDPATDWSQGLTDAQGGTTEGLTASVGSGRPNSKPTLSKQFNMNWKIVRITEVSLSPGRIHEHKFHMKMNRIIDYEHFDNNQQIGGFTYFPLVVTQGQPVGTGVAATPTTLGYHTFGYTFTQRVRGRAISIFPKQVWQSNNLQTDMTGATATIMNDDTEEPQTWVNAGVFVGNAS